MTTRTEVERAFLLADLSGYTALTEAHGNHLDIETGGLEGPQTPTTLGTVPAKP